MFYKDTLKVRLYTYPVVGLICFVIAKTFLAFLFDFSRVWVHEFGHAIMAWISGIKALPLAFFGAGFTFGAEEKSFWFYALFSLLLFFMTSYGKRKNYPYVFRMGFTLLVITFIATWLIPLKKTHELIVLSGFAGEIIFSTFLVVSFYFRLPEKCHWRYFFRWIALIVGFYSLTKTSMMWLEAKKTKSFEVFGTNFSESATMGVAGDLHRLMFDYKWDLSNFFSLYLSLIAISWIMILITYLYFLTRKIIPDEFGVD